MAQELKRHRKPGVLMSNVERPLRSDASLVEPESILCNGSYQESSRREREAYGNECARRFGRDVHRRLEGALLVASMAKALSDLVELPAEAREGLNVRPLHCRRSLNN